MAAMPCLAFSQSAMRAKTQKLGEKWKTRKNEYCGMERVTRLRPMRISSKTKRGNQHKLMEIKAARE